MAILSNDTIAALDKKLPTNWSRSNPVEIFGDTSGKRYADALEALIGDREVDAILVLHCYRCRHLCRTILAQPERN